MARSRLTAVLLSVALVATALGPAAVAASDGSFAVDVTQEAAGEPANVTVTHNGSAVPNASVTVDTMGNSSYVGANTTYETGENGTVTLPAPLNESVRVTVTASYENLTDSVDVTLEYPENETNETENETLNATNGTEGTFNRSNVTVNSSFNVSNYSTFGGAVTAYQDLLRSDNTSSNVPFGLRLAAFVVRNNPGADNRPDGAGPSWLFGDANASDNETERGPPEDRGNGNAGANDDDNETERGPPEDRGNAGDNGPPDDTGPSSQDDNGPPEDRGDGTVGSADDDNGPPEDRGNGNTGAADDDNGPPEDRGNGNAGSSDDDGDDDDDDGDSDDGADTNDDGGPGNGNAGGNAGDNGGGNGNAGGNGGGNGNAGGNGNGGGPP